MADGGAIGSDSVSSAQLKCVKTGDFAVFG